MNPWQQTAGAVALCAGGAVFARWLARQATGWWVTAFVVSLGIIFIYGVERYTVGLESIPPFSWIWRGRHPQILGALVIPIALLTPARRLAGMRLRILMGGLAAMALASFVVMPFLLPALAVPELSKLSTKIDRDGICIQQTDYTCGPAAAVTALRRMGLPADEGQLAIWSSTSPYGTMTEDLLEAINEHYGRDGVSASYQQFKSVGELREAGPTLAVVKFGFLVDHFVCVLEATNGHVIVGDPLNGRAEYSESQFADYWRFSGIVLAKQR